MARDAERIERIRMALLDAELDAVVCALPKNVLLLTGYWPIAGTAIAIATKEGNVTLVAPEDERALYESAGADRIIPFSSGSLAKLTTLMEDVHDAFSKAMEGLHSGNCRIGIELLPTSEQASYVAMTLYGHSILALLRQTLKAFTHTAADDILARERSILTTHEQGRVRLAVAIAEQAFETGAKRLEIGMNEIETAQYFEVPLSTYAIALETVGRASGHVSCMSGQNAGKAYGSFARSTRKIIGPQDLILTHCNSHADGYWTDVTRTYFRGDLPERPRQMYEAVFDASQIGIATLKPGMAASEVDRSVREVLKEKGFGEQFKHGTGHGVGLSAIDHRALPRLQPNSPDILETGMIFNIEPAVYFEDYGGIRQCDMILVTENGGEVLTSFQNTIDDIIL